MFIRSYFLILQYNMNFLARIVNSFVKPDISKKIYNFCSSSLTEIDHHQSSLLIKQLILSHNCQSAIKELILLLNQSSPIARLKFLSVIFISQQLNSLSQYFSLIQSKLIRSTNQISFIQVQSQFITNQLLFYLVRSIKHEYKQKAKGGAQESTVAMNRMYINFAYKFINDINCLLVLHVSFNQLFSKNADVPFLEQVYYLIVREVNQLYECFKQSINYYFTGFDREQVMQNLQQIKQLIASNKQTYRKMRQFYGTNDFLLGKKNKFKNIGCFENLVEYGQVPLSVQRWFSKISRTQRDKVCEYQYNMVSSLVTNQSINTLTAINQI